MPSSYKDLFYLELYDGIIDEFTYQILKTLLIPSLYIAIMDKNVQIPEHKHYFCLKFDISIADILSVAVMETL
jgi:hypothetical protein